MGRDKIREGIEANLRAAGLAIEELRVQPDLYGGWQIIAVSSGFKGLTQIERRRVALLGLEAELFEWVELLTPEEREWAGSLPSGSEIETLPLWPEALARGARREKRKHLFPSDLDEDIEPPVVVTFYSLRGGVGRSTALAYTGQILAARGYKVVCVDMDLEAPGLAALFGKEQEVEEGAGLLHLLVAIDSGKQPDLAKHLLRIDEAKDLYCLPAGRPDAEYARLLRFVDPASWYLEESNPLHTLLQQLREGLPFKPDVILLDSRTGITALSAPLLFDLADIAIIVFFPHPQARSGTAALVGALLAAHTRRCMNGKLLTPEPRFLVSPIPASKAPEVVQRYEHRALQWISEWLSGLNGGGRLIDSDVTHFVPYREVVATSDSVLRNEDVWRDFQPVADWVASFLPTSVEGSYIESLETLKDVLLRDLRFSAGTAEQYEQGEFLATFVETEMMRKAFDPAVPLVLGRKGTGKTAIFRRLAEDKDHSAIVIASPAPLRGGRGWLLGSQGLLQVGKLLERSPTVDWRQFWSVYISLACYWGWPGDRQRPGPDAALAGRVPAIVGSELEMARTLEKLLGHERSGLLADDWLTKLDRAVPSETVLLFDGLDTGFGSTDEDRVRRRAALEGLFSLVTDRADLRHLRFKILLREDIWRQLKFENKSHFFGRSTTLRWTDQAAFFKVALKQAQRTVSFGRLLENRFEREAPVDEWGEQEVFGAWSMLVGERMKGGKTAFTRNWVWNRLADGNEDHSPRYLLQLMHQAGEWERDQHPRSPYFRSVIRPRGLIEVLPEVSKQALAALRDEEFPEIEPLLQKLREIGRTPLDANQLPETLGNLVRLAREVGLLGVYEGSEEQVERYKVPELFRYELEMTRKGQK